MKYDVAILGGGPGGYESAIRCAQLGLKTALIEARDLGGTCLNRGCIPTKALLHSAEIYENAKEAENFGVSTGTVTYDYGVMAARKDTIVTSIRKSIGIMQKKHGVEVINGFGRLKDSQTIEVGEQLVKADKIILAMGSVPSRPPIPGLDGENILTSDEVLALKDCPESMIIIGGGVIGIEFATLYATLGKKVTVLEMMPSILPGVDRDMVELISMVLETKGVEVITGAKVLSIEGGKNAKVNYSLNEIEQSVVGGCCLVSVGRSPMTSQI
ncbi:MAG: FAD-dependent oxidoreductase, partial [Acidaminobacter sp.]|uniref:dihydrolipoyl dehydrogenase family protein n=1 Tax=Acidaminobacter sp. TaxID=1872102 RepID=UPI00137C54F2